MTSRSNNAKHPRSAIPWILGGIIVIAFGGAATLYYSSKQAARTEDARLAHEQARQAYEKEKAKHAQEIAKLKAQGQAKLKALRSEGRPTAPRGLPKARTMGGAPEVRGSLDKAIIRRVIRRHINEVKYCYQKGLVDSPDLAGRVMIGFTIGTTGQVKGSQVQTSTLRSREVELCIASAVKRWLFPAPRGGIVNVKYPFVLRPVGQ